MQIYALNTEGLFLHVSQSNRNSTYICPECKNYVKSRGGRFRQPHYYHLQSASCRLQGKSLVHLHIQHILQKMLAPEPILLEHRFPNIGRIADVFYPSRQIIFEVQVSPISIEEIRARNKDYASLGYDVIWILHDRQFNRVRATSAETFLATSPHYFTNINRFGKGFFYDQYSLIRFKRRLRRTPRFPVRFKRIYSLKDKQLPSQLPKERKKWSLSVEGDLFNRSFHWEQEKISLHPLKFFARFYTFLLNLFLEKTSG